MVRFMTYTEGVREFQPRVVAPAPTLGPEATSDPYAEGVGQHCSVRLTTTNRKLALHYSSPTPSV